MDASALDPLIMFHVIWDKWCDFFRKRRGYGRIFTNIAKLRRGQETKSGGTSKSVNQRMNYWINKCIQLVIIVYFPLPQNSVKQSKLLQYFLKLQYIHNVLKLMREMLKKQSQNGHLAHVCTEQSKSSFLCELPIRTLKSCIIIAVCNINVPWENINYCD